MNGFSDIGNIIIIITERFSTINQGEESKKSVIFIYNRISIFF